MRVGILRPALPRCHISSGIETMEVSSPEELLWSPTPASPAVVDLEVSPSPSAGGYTPPEGEDGATFPNALRFCMLGCPAQRLRRELDDVRRTALATQVSYKAYEKRPLVCHSMLNLAPSLAEVVSRGRIVSYSCRNFM